MPEVTLLIDKEQVYKTNIDTNIREEKTQLNDNSKPYIKTLTEEQKTYLKNFIIDVRYKDDLIEDKNPRVNYPYYYEDKNQKQNFLTTKIEYKNAYLTDITPGPLTQDFIKYTLYDSPNGKPITLLNEPLYKLKNLGGGQDANRAEKIQKRKQNETVENPFVVLVVKRLFSCHNCKKINIRFERSHSYSQFHDGVGKKGFRIF